jgi:hypothetical protein
MKLGIPERRPMILTKAKEQVGQVRNIRTKLTLADVAKAAISGSLMLMAQRVHVKGAQNGSHNQPKQR